MTALRPLFRPLSRSLAIATALTIVVATATVLVWMTPQIASAQTAEEIRAQRDNWQRKYRALLSDRVRLKENIAKSRKNYSQAQRRNYPRGGARQKFLVDAENAEKALAATEEAIAEIFTDARREGVPPGWLYEVEDEPIEATRPAASDSNAVDPEDRAGRNPIYFEDGDF
ncbi:MAG: hypothetical protein GY910_09310 [bacterium]|nr:hypothetical protein [Deltaproteobacteria bacterium]MCP4905166.1 hypothetical protein [bacterium]